MGRHKETALSAAVAEVIEGFKLHIMKIGVYDNETLKTALREDLEQLIEIQRRLN